MYTGIVTVVFFLYWGHCECLDSLVDPVRVLSVVMFLILFYEQIQDAQLSQRDRAAGCVILSPKVEDWNKDTIFYRHYRSIFNHCDIIGLKIRRIR